MDGPPQASGKGFDLKREHVHLIGIGGTGMTALAGLLDASGCRVTGSDVQLYQPTAGILEELGLDVREGFDPASLDTPPDMVVVGNAISRGNPELEALMDRGLPQMSAASAVGFIILGSGHPYPSCQAYPKDCDQSKADQPNFLSGDFSMKDCHSS